MIQKTSKFAVVFIIILLVVSIYGVFPVRAPARSDLLFIPYESKDAAYAALKNDEADILCMDLCEEQKIDAEEDPSLQICRYYKKNDVFEYALNNNYSILDYPNAKSPTSKREVRQAIAHLIDKTYIINDILKGQGVIIDQPIPASQISWCNESVIGENYPYPYDPDRAAEILATLGFNDTDGNGWLNYPIDWPGAPGADTGDYPLKILIRSDDEARLLVGRYLVDQLTNTLAAAMGAGFACNTIEGTADVILPILLEKNFHVYTQGYITGRFPTHLFFFYHSMFWCTSNIVTNYEHPLLDQYLQEFYYAQSIEEARDACKKACGYMADHCVTIPLWSSGAYAYQAWRKEVPGVVCMAGCGLNNKYTYMNAYRADTGAPVRVAVFEPVQLNVIYSLWSMDWEILNAIHPHLLNVNPYDLAIDQPWVAQDWEVGTWTDQRDGQNKTKVTFWIRKDVGIAAPGIVTHPRNYTADDAAFTIWYTYAFQDAWNWEKVMDVHHTEIVDNQTIVVYFDKKSMWFLYDIGELPLLVKDELVKKLSQAPLYPLMEEKTVSFLCLGNEVQFTNDSLVQVINATADGMTIHENTNFIIRAGQDVYCHNVFVPVDIPLELPWNITITYYCAPNPPTGYYLGSDAGLSWQDTMYTAAPHYPSSSPYDLKKNMHFFLDPPLGETDWRWYWDTPGGIPGWENPGRDSGYFKINIYDVVKATASYCHRGDGPYDPHYFPGADLDASDLCHIGIYDIVTITGKYGMEWGAPPP